MMLRDFTLRGVALQDFRGRDESLFDLTFRGGRLTRKKRLPELGQRNLFLTPGFNDAHIHLLHLGLSRQRCNLSGCGSLDEALETVAEFSRGGHTSGDILWAVNWDESHWADQRLPTREEIDRVVADSPVVMRRVCGHRAVLNTAAMQEAGRRWGALDPGGHLSEEQAMGLANLWPPTPEELEEAFLSAQDAAIAMGITRASEMGSHAALDTYLTLEERGLLKIDVKLFVAPERLEEVVRLRQEGRFTGPRLRLGGVKLYADGSVGARTAALRHPYEDAAHTGRLLYQDQDLFDMLDRCAREELPAAIHAIGDAAIDQVLHQLERIAQERGLEATRGVSIEHAEMVDTPMLDRIEALEIGLSMQPNFVERWGRPGGLYDRALGSQRCMAMNPFREVWDRKLPLVFGSDGMPMDPSMGLEGAVSHPMAEARLMSEEALSAYLGGRLAAAGYWDSEDWWAYGRGGGVLYGYDPLDLTSGDLSRVPVQGVLWCGEWVLEPSADLFRAGVVHAG
ncbi:amidohydrolase [Candidatus Eisenbacteria bacterium]|uniref:Amidohydrolase n=1 Tax=Eiseniibacteriota bacterium TaxID=2212470 RepID=A0ABV6YK91_UNCEI